MGLRGLAIITAVVEKSRDSDSWSYEDTIKVSWNCNASWRGYILIWIPLGGSFACVILCILFVGCNKRYDCCNRIRSRSWPRYVRASNTMPSLSQPQQTSPQRDSVSLNHLAQPQPLDRSVALKKRQRISICITSFIFAPILASALTVLEGILPVWVAYNAAESLVLTPGETRSFPVNKFFCSSMSIDITGSSRLSASIWIMEMNPQLTQSSHVMSSANFVCDIPNMLCYQAWRSYMHHGSTLHVKAANYGKNTAYIICFHDEESFNNFLTNPKKYKNESIYYIEADNEIEIENQFDKRGNQILVLFSTDVTEVNISLDFNRTEFSTSKLSSISYCELHSYTKTYCKLPIPFGKGNVYGLVEVKNDSSNYTWEYVTAEKKCNFRASSWTALWLPILMVNIPLAWIFIFLYTYYKMGLCCLAATHRDAATRNTAPVPSPDATDAAPAAPDAATTDTATDAAPVAATDATTDPAPVATADATTDAAPVATGDDLNKQSFSNTQFVSSESNQAHSTVSTQAPVAATSSPSREVGISSSDTSAIAATVTCNGLSATSSAKASVHVPIGNSNDASAYERPQLVVSPMLVPVAISNKAKANSMHTAEEDLAVTMATSETDPLLQ